MCAPVQNEHPRLCHPRQRRRSWPECVPSVQEETPARLQNYGQCLNFCLSCNGIFIQGIRTLSARTIWSIRGKNALMKMAHRRYW